MKELSKKEIVSLSFLLGSLLFGLLFLIFYLNFGAIIFHPDIEANVIITACFSLALLLAGFVFPSKLLLEGSFLLSFLSFLFYLNSQLTFITNVFVSIDQTSFSIGFIFNFLFGILSFVFSLVSSILEDKILPLSFRFVKKEDEIHVQE